MYCNNDVNGNTRLQLNQNCPHHLAIRITGFRITDKAVVISYKNAINTTYSTYQLDQVHFMENNNDFIVESCTD